MSTRVLIVEDSLDYADNLREVLSGAGYEVSHAATVGGALALAKERGFDVGLVDVHLPDAYGTEALAGLRDACPDSELLMMTGDASLDTAIASVRGGARAYLVKPVRIEELLSAVAVAAQQAALRREREQLVARLASSEARYRGLVETSGALILGVEPDCTIALFNAACEIATGRKRKDVLGRQLAELGPATPNELEGLLSLQTARGEERMVHWRRTEIGGVTYAIGIDMTEHAELERRMHAAERLAAAGQLTAGLAHEVRNPLNAALLELKVLERSLLKLGHQDGLESVATIRSELERLQRLAEEFLELARPRQAEHTVGDVRAAVESVVRLVGSEAAARGLIVAVDQPDEPVTAAFDEARLRQVLLNLVTNALDVLERGGRVTLRTRVADAEVRLEVEDDGPGIPGEPERVFDPFFTTKPTGTGLGLSIARRIVNDHQGRIRVRSRPGRTTFTVSLPLIEPAG